MANKFEEEQTKELLQAFKLFDKDNDGEITKDEVIMMLRQLGGKESEAQMQQIITQIDIDGNGMINFPEFLSLMAKKMTSTNSEVQIAEAFRIFDCNNDKFITFEELKAVLGKLGEKMSDEQIKSMITQADEDGDGKISFQDFQKLMKR